MKNDKKIKTDQKTSPQSFWRQQTQFPHFFKNLFVFLAFFIFFTLAIFLVWKQQVSKPRQLPVEEITLQQEPLPALAPAPAPVPSEGKSEGLLTSLQSTVTALDSRLAALELKILQQASSQTPRKLIALELIKGVLEEGVPLGALKIFLQKIPEPWAGSLGAPLAPIETIESYSELDALLIVSVPSAPLSLWQRIKRKIKSLVRIQKVDEKGQCKLGQLEDIQKALHAHNLEKALELFDALPLAEQTPLVSWKQKTHNRLLLEKMKRTLLLEIAGE